MRSKPWLIALVVCLTVTGSLAGIKFLQISAAIAMAESFPPPYSVVTATQARTTEWVPTRRLTGSVRAPEFIEVAAENAGRVVALPAAAGSVVERGDTIFKLFDEDLDAQKKALEADLSLTTLQLERTRKLKSDSLASQDQLDTLLARSDSLRAQIAATEAALSRMTIRAPFTGRLGIYTLSLGDLMQAGDRLTTLTGVGDERWVDFKVPQGVADVENGDRVTILSLDRQPLGEAQVIAVSDALSAGIRAFDVRARISNSPLRHGELVLVEILIGENRQVMALPRPAVRWGPDGAHVFVLEPAEPDSYTSHRAHLRKIEVLIERDSEALVWGDVVAGERVAVSGAFKLTDQSLANIADATPQS